MAIRMLASPSHLMDINARLINQVSKRPGLGGLTPVEAVNRQTQESCRGRPHQFAQVLNRPSHSLGRLYRG